MGLFFAELFAFFEGQGVAERLQTQHRIVNDEYDRAIRKASDARLNRIEAIQSAAEQEVEAIKAEAEHTAQRAEDLSRVVCLDESSAYALLRLANSVRQAI